MIFVSFDRSVIFYDSDFKKQRSIDDLQKDSN